MAAHDRQHEHIGQNLSEITDKLNALVEIVDEVIRKPPPNPPA